MESRDSFDKEETVNPNSALIAEDLSREFENRRNATNFYVTHGELIYKNIPNEPKTYVIGIFHARNMLIIPLHGLQRDQAVLFASNKKDPASIYVDNIKKTFLDTVTSIMTDKNDVKRLVLIADVNLGYSGNYFPTFFKEIAIADKSVIIFLTSSTKEVIQKAEEHFAKSRSHLFLKQKHEMTPHKIKEILLSITHSPDNEKKTVSSVDSINSKRI